MLITSITIILGIVTCKSLLWLRPNILCLQTPTTSSRRRTLAACTPSVPARKQPVRECGTALERARAQLHVGVVPDTLPCREEEFANILGYVESKLESRTGGYVVRLAFCTAFP